MLVDSVRGPGGGYCLARPVTEISVADIVVAVDEPLDATQCAGGHNCHNQHTCMTHDLWEGLNQTIYSYLESITLAQLMDHHDARQRGENVVKFDQPIGRIAEPAAPVTAH